MWILPKQLHTSVFVPDTAVLISDLNEQSQICAQSLFVRSKPSQLATWLRKWKRDSWTALLSGRILKPSHGQSFLDAWTSSLAAIPAGHSVPLGSDLEKMTQGTCGPSSQTEFGFSNPELASSKTLTDTSRWDSPQSSVTWKKWVTKQRGEFLARLKSERRINASGSSSLESCPQTVASYKDANWPTVRAQEPGTTSPGYGRGLAATVEEKYKNWPTISVNEAKNGGPSQEQRNSVPLGTLAGLLDPANPNTHGNPQGSFSEFQTPKTGDCKLQDQVKTPSKKLNPRWVEALMGVPFGWVSPFPVEEESNTNRIDELRLLGNGVVPGTALKAFLTLIQQNQTTT